MHGRSGCVCRCAPICPRCRFPKTGINKNWGHCKRRNRFYNCRRSFNWGESVLYLDAAYYEDWDLTIVDYDFPVEEDKTVFSGNEEENYSNGPEHAFPPKEETGHVHAADSREADGAAKAGVAGGDVSTSEDGAVGVDKGHRSDAHADNNKDDNYVRVIFNTTTRTSSSSGHGNLW